MQATIQILLHRKLKTVEVQHGSIVGHTLMLAGLLPVKSPYDQRDASHVSIISRQSEGAALLLFPFK